MSKKEDSVGGSEGDKLKDQSKKKTGSGGSSSGSGTTTTSNTATTTTTKKSSIHRFSSGNLTNLIGLGKKRKEHNRGNSHVTDPVMESSQLSENSTDNNDTTTTATTVTASTTAATLDSEVENTTSTNNIINSTIEVETATSGNDVAASATPAPKIKKSHNNNKKRQSKQHHLKDSVEGGITNETTTTTTTTITTTPSAIKQRQYRHRVRTNSQTYLLERQLSEGSSPPSFTDYCDNLMSTQAPVDHLKTYGLGTEMLDSVDALEPFEASVMTGFFGCSEADHQTHVALWVSHNRSISIEGKINELVKIIYTLESRVMTLDGTVEKRAGQQREDFRIMRSVYKDDEIQRLKSALEKEEVKQLSQNARLESLEKILQTLLSNYDLDNQTRLHRNGSTIRTTGGSNGSTIPNSALVLNSAKDNLKRTLSTALSDFDDSQ